MGSRLGNRLGSGRLGARLGRSAGNTPYTYLLRDDFNLDAPAPLVSPRTCVPGPGTLTIVDTGNTLSISGAQIVPSAATTGAQDPMIYQATGYSRVVGRAFIARVKSNSAFGSDANKTQDPDVGWYNFSPPNGLSMYGLLWRSVLSAFFAESSAVSLGTAYPCTADQFYQIANVLRSTGCFSFADQVLMWVKTTLTDATIYPLVKGIGSNRYNFNLDYFRVRDLGGIFATDNGIATVNVTASSGVTQVADANGIYDLAITLPAGSANLVAAELRFRQQDATNYWTFYIKRNAGNTAWDVYLDKVTAGTPATQSGYPVTGVGTVDMLRVIADGTKINCYCKVTTTWTKRGGEIADAAFQTQQTVNPIAGAGTTLGALLCWARRSSLYSVLGYT